MRAYDLIRKKRDGEALTREEIAFLVGGLMDGSVPDYQASAFLMAVYQRGMGLDETTWLTEAMVRSGRTLGFPGLTGIVVDKHSTGGVGDKTSIILAPMLASMGLRVPKLAGRSLGYTGGTIDKLESIPGMRTDLTLEEAERNLREIGVFIMAQTEEIAPADKSIYALRDATATVESIPLIASSVMSKKLSEGIEGLVLDVKCGSGAFMKTLEDARELARTMVHIGNAMGVKTVALVTDMDQPLGRTVGNALEVKECVSAMRGRGAKDLVDLTITLSSWVLNLADAIGAETEPVRLDKFTLGKYQQESLDFLEKGDAFKKFVEMVDAQGGDPEAAFRMDLLPSASIVKPITAPKDGFVRRLDAHAVGRAAAALGAGREKKGDSIDHAAGIVLNKKQGDEVRAGEPVALLHMNDEARYKEAEEAFLSGLEIGDRDIARRPLVLDVVMAGGG